MKLVKWCHFILLNVYSYVVGCISHLGSHSSGIMLAQWSEQYELLNSLFRFVLIIMFGFVKRKISSCVLHFILSIPLKINSDTFSNTPFPYLSFDMRPVQFVLSKLISPVATILLQCSSFTVL